MEVMGRLLFAVSLLAAGKALETRTGTIITMPNRLMPGKNETICVVFSGNISDASVTYNVTSTNQLISKWRFNVSSVGATCQKISLPKEFSQTTVYFGVEVIARDYKFSRIKKLSVLTESSEFTLIQTDKPVYKPGQAVKMRIMTLTTELLPVLEQKYNVSIEDPSGVRVEQWLDVAPTKGLAQLEFMLNSEPPLGKWSITCQVAKRREKANFLVQEYVLPRFEVNIKAPKSIRIDDEFISGEVCASYTYGQPVKGETNISFAAKPLKSFNRYNPGNGNAQTIAMEINGCAKFSLRATTLDLGNRNSYGKAQQLEINADVTEQGTGMKINASAVSIAIESRRAKIEIKGNDKYKPGLDYSGKVKVTQGDKLPFIHQIVQVIVRDQGNTIHLHVKTLTDKKGEVTYTLPTPGGLIHQYTVEASLLTENGTYEWHRPKATKVVDPWYSPSGSYLQLQMVPPVDRLPCEHDAQLYLHYTTNELHDVQLVTQVAGLNDIVFSSANMIKLEPQLLIDWTSSGNASSEAESFPAHSMNLLRVSQASRNVRLSHRGRTTISIKVTSTMAPVARLLVFYTRKDGEIVADALSLEVEKCTPNKVGLSFTSPMVRPGEQLGLRFTAAPKSLCAYGTVDKSVYLIGGENQLNFEQLYGRLQKYMNSPETNLEKAQEEQSHCQRLYQQMTPQALIDSRITDESTRRRWDARRTHYSSMYKDASHAFNLGATAVLTDLTLNTRPCTLHYRYDPEPVWKVSARHRWVSDIRGKSFNLFDPVTAEQHTTNQQTTSVYKPIVEVRTYFPETWLWNIIEIGETGHETLPLHAPHTVTEWKGSATCIHETEGFGVSQVTSMKVFQPFFVSVELPYAVIRDESVPITATVYNYHSEPLSVEVHLKRSRDFTILNLTSHTILCICPQDSKSHRYSIIPKKIGDVNITINSVSVTNASDCSKECKMSSRIESIVGYRDAVVKQMLVHPEGLPRQYTHSSYVCLHQRRTSERRNYILKLPTDLIPKSQRAFVSVIGDVMGPSLANLDNLLRMPCGCGEQNMLGFAPNIFVMQYLEATMQSSDVIRTTAVRYMKSGYQRQLTYSHEDRSYSAFGTNDSEGSIWLTAFVVKCFAQARQFIYIDKSNLEASIRYFGRHQTNSGCFRRVGRVIHKDMTGGLAGTSEAQDHATLTAYIIIALLEADEVEEQREMVQKAFRCLDNQTVNDPYSVALFSYAYALYDVGSERSVDLIQTLRNLAIQQGDTMHWKTASTARQHRKSSVAEPMHEKPTATDVETTAYAMLALLKHNSTAEETLPVVRWLTQQRNPYGGFVSTQDTILAIQALARYAAANYVEDFNMSVSFEHDNKIESFKVNSRNSLHLQSKPVDLEQRERSSLAVRFSGSGCALVQANVRYNIKLNVTSQSAFETRVKTCQSAGAGTKRKSCERQTLAVCTRYLGADAFSNMAIVDVNMVSGWVADKDSIRLLQSDKALGLKRFEVNERTVSFYFEQINGQEKCFKFEVIQEQTVENTKGVAVTTYDYYNPDLRHETNYNLNVRNCSAICSRMTSKIPASAIVKTMTEKPVRAPPK